MATDCVSEVDMAVSDEPLDLSVDKNKCPRDRSSVNAAVKRKAAEASAAADAAETWNAQPHLQMAANFSTVLQYYLTAARLWHQNSEVIQRCHESQQRPGSSAEHSDDGGPAPLPLPLASTDVDLATPHSQPTAETAAAATTAAAAGAINANNSSKRRKKEADSSAGDAASGNRPRKTRTTFTGKQLFELERIFEQKKYLSSNERQEVARLLNVTGSQIKIWFQNRRTKWKKQDPNTAAELAQLKSASRVSKSKSGSDRSQQDAAAISAGEMSDAATNISSAPVSPSPPV